MCFLVLQKMSKIRSVSQGQKRCARLSIVSSIIKKDGTSLAKNGLRMRWTMQRGITLVELLVVVALLGFLALLGTAQLTHIVQKNQLQSAAWDVTSFLQSVPDLVSKQQAPLFVRFLPPAGGAPSRLEISRDVAGGDVLRQLALPPEVAFSLTSLGNQDISWPKAGATGVFTLRCDTFGRATNPDTGGQLNGEARLLLTHVNMVKGTLTPKYGFVVGVAPVWNVTNTKVYSWNP